MSDQLTDIFNRICVAITELDLACEELKVPKENYFSRLISFIEYLNNEKDD